MGVDAAAVPAADGDAPMDVEEDPEHCGGCSQPLPVNAIEYLNRLGDLLFVLARHANHAERVADDPWHPSRP